jgi:curved DNA-binding protein CbpA
MPQLNKNDIERLIKQNGQKPELNYYEKLGISPDASQQQISSTLLAQQEHLDAMKKWLYVEQKTITEQASNNRLSEQDAAGKNKDIEDNIARIEAYEHELHAAQDTLMDEKNRQQYKQEQGLVKEVVKDSALVFIAANLTPQFSKAKVALKKIEEEFKKWFEGSQLSDANKDDLKNGQTDLNQLMQTKGFSMQRQTLGGQEGLSIQFSGSEAMKQFNQLLQTKNMIEPMSQDQQNSLQSMLQQSPDSNQQTSPSPSPLNNLG